MDFEPSVLGSEALQKVLKRKGYLRDFFVYHIVLYIIRTLLNCIGFGKAKTSQEKLQI